MKMRRPHKLCTLNRPNRSPVLMPRAFHFNMLWNNITYRLSLYAMRSWNIMRSARNSQKIRKSVAGSDISNEVPATKRHGQRWKIQTIIFHDRFPALRHAPSEPPRLEIIYAWKAIHINLVYPTLVTQTCHMTMSCPYKLCTQNRPNRSPMLMPRSFFNILWNNITNRPSLHAMWNLKHCAQRKKFTTKSANPWPKTRFLKKFRPPNVTDQDGKYQKLFFMIASRH